MPLFGYNVEGMVDEILQVVGANIVGVVAKGRDAGADLFGPVFLRF